MIADQSTGPDVLSLDGVFLLKWAGVRRNRAETLSQNPPHVQRPEVGQEMEDRFKGQDQGHGAELQLRRRRLDWE